MKIRNGFVSNSSSSSFMITMKNNKELTKDNIMDVLNVNKDSFFYNIALEISEVFVRNSDLADIDYLFGKYGYMDKDDPTLEEKIENLVEEVSFLDKKMLEDIHNNKVKFYIGDVSDDDGGIEAALCSMDINHGDDDMRVEKEGGY